MQERGMAGKGQGEASAGPSRQGLGLGAIWGQ